MSPWKSMYSSGWSSVWTARGVREGSGGMPFGTAHETSTPARSSRRSQCRLRAWCSWTTKRSPVFFFFARPAGSGVLRKSRFFLYSPSFCAISPQHGNAACACRRHAGPELGRVDRTAGVGHHVPAVVDEGRLGDTGRAIGVGAVALGLAHARIGGAVLAREVPGLLPEVLDVQAEEQDALRP